MKAVIYTRYGPPDVLQLTDIERPTPGDNELLVKVHASTVTAGTIIARSATHPDSRLFSFMSRLMFGVRAPKVHVLGYEVSGEVEAVGKDVTRFAKGDLVYGTTTGLRQGGYAEYVCIPEEWKQGVVTKKPDSLTHHEAAALPISAMTALHILRKADIQKGQTILIYGASGGVGTNAVQLAKHMGAKVTGVCSTGNMELVSSLGAEDVIDYTKEDVTLQETGYDVVFDAVGKLKGGKRCLKPGGRYLSVLTPTAELTEYLDYLHEIIAEGSLRPFIDRTYPLEETAEAHRYVDTWHKRGNVVISVIPPDTE